MTMLEFELPIYTFQIDFVGHVSNIVYVQWMEIGRTKLLEAAGLPVDEISKTGVIPVLVSTQIEYKVPLLLGDRVRVQVWISEFKRASACLAFRFYEKGHVLAASGSQRGLFVPRESMRPTRISPEMRAAFRPFVAGGPG